MLKVNKNSMLEYGIKAILRGKFVTIGKRTFGKYDHQKTGMIYSDDSIDLTITFDEAIHDYISESYAFQDNIFMEIVIDGLKTSNYGTVASFKVLFHSVDKMEYSFSAKYEGPQASNMYSIYSTLEAINVAAPWIL